MEEIYTIRDLRLLVVLVVFCYVVDINASFVCTPPRLLILLPLQSCFSVLVRSVYSHTRVSIFASLRRLASGFGSHSCHSSTNE